MIYDKVSIAVTSDEDYADLQLFRKICKEKRISMNLLFKLTVRAFLKKHSPEHQEHQEHQDGK